MARASLIDTLLAPRIAALREALPAATTGDGGSVHKARVASRRIREVLPVTRAALGDATVERARRHVRYVTRALGPLRELDVALIHFETLAAAHALDTTAAAAVRRGLQDARTDAFRHMRRSLPARRRARLDVALDTITMPPSSPAADEAVRRAIIGRVASRSARVLEALDRAGAVYMPERLHQVRIAVKQLRYAFEMALEAGQGSAKGRVQQLRRVQELLGHAHDLHVLSERVRDVQGAVVTVSRRTGRSLGRFARVLDIACRADHAAFMSRKAALQRACAPLRRVARPSASPTPGDVA